MQHRAMFIQHRAMFIQCSYSTVQFIFSVHTAPCNVGKQPETLARWETSRRHSQGGSPAGEAAFSRRRAKQDPSPSRAVASIQMQTKTALAHLCTARDVVPVCKPGVPLLPCAAMKGQCNGSPASDVPHKCVRHLAAKRHQPWQCGSEEQGGFVFFSRKCVTGSARNKNLWHGVLTGCLKISRHHLVSPSPGSWQLIGFS